MNLNKTQKIDLAIWITLMIFILSVLGIFFLFNQSFEIVNKTIEENNQNNSKIIYADPCTLSSITCEENETSSQEEVKSKVKQGTFVCYTSEVAQTDADPFTTASGERVRSGIVANNCLHFGQRIKIIFPERINKERVWPVLQEHNVSGLVVEDRMNERYGCNTFDIWWGETYEDKLECLKFGRRELDYLVLTNEI